MPKTVLPRRLKELINDLKKENLVNGFRRCGIYPLHRSQILSRLLTEDDPVERNLRIDGCFIGILNSASGKNGTTPKGGKQISFSPGKDISHN